MPSPNAVSPQAPSAGAGTRKGRDRARHILDTAVHVFVTHGYAQFTVRAVAEAAGISSGNLNYYFPRKHALLSAMVEHVLADYLGAFEHQRGLAPGDARAQLERVLDFWIDDLATAHTTRFFPELWALANHDPAAARLMNLVYERARQVLVDLLREVYPGLAPADRDLLSLLMCATLEGLTLFAGHRKPWAAQRARLRTTCKQLFAALPAVMSAAD